MVLFRAYKWERKREKREKEFGFELNHLNHKQNCTIVIYNHVSVVSSRQHEFQKI